MYIEAIGPDCQPLVLVGANDILTHLDEVPVQGLTSTRQSRRCAMPARFCEPRFAAACTHFISLWSHLKPLAQGRRLQDNLVNFRPKTNR
jgi:hypothetical protein